MAHEIYATSISYDIAFWYLTLFAKGLPANEQVTSIQFSINCGRFRIKGRGCLILELSMTGQLRPATPLIVKYAEQ